MSNLKKTPTGNLRKNPNTGRLVRGCAGCCEPNFCVEGDCSTLPTSLLLDLSTITPCESCEDCDAEPDYGDSITLTRGSCFGTPVRAIWTAQPDSGGGLVCIAGKLTTTSLVRLTYFSETCDFVLEWSCYDPAADGQFKLVIRATKSASDGDPTGSYTITDSGCGVTGTVEVS